MNKWFLLSKVEALIKGVGTGMLQTVSFYSWALVIWVGAIIVTAKRATRGNVTVAVMSILFGDIYGSNFHLRKRVIVVAHNVAFLKLKNVS